MWGVIIWYIERLFNWCTHTVYKNLNTGVLSSLLRSCFKIEGIRFSAGRNIFQCAANSSIFSFEVLVYGLCRCIFLRYQSSHKATSFFYQPQYAKASGPSLRVSQSQGLPLLCTNSHRHLTIRGSGKKSCRSAESWHSTRSSCWHSQEKVAYRQKGITLSSRIRTFEEITNGNVSVKKANNSL